MHVTRKRLDLKDKRQNFFFCSDIHFGSKAADIGRFRKDLKKAKRLDARILILGDVFDLIYSKDKRHNPSLLIDDLQGIDNPVDHAIDLMYDEMEPYKNLIDGIGIGNHEASFIKYNATNPVERLVGILNHDGADVEYLFYSGYFLYDLYTNNKKRQEFNILWHHGSGGGAPVTKGMIDINRKQTSFEYDLYLFGHKHKKIADASIRIAPQRGRNRDWIEERPMKSAQTGSYLKAYEDDEKGKMPGYAEVRQHSPNPLGGVFGEVELIRDGAHYQIDVGVTI